jgi:hypothetical protein
MRVEHPITRQRSNPIARESVVATNSPNPSRDREGAQ